MCFVISDKAKISILLHSLTSIRFNIKGIHKGVHYGNVSYCFKNQDLKDLSIRYALVHLVLNSLLAQFNLFKAGCNY